MLVCVSTCVYVCMDVYIYIYIHVYIFMQICVHVYMLTCMYALLLWIGEGEGKKGPLNGGCFEQGFKPGASNAKFR